MMHRMRKRDKNTHEHVQAFSKRSKRSIGCVPLISGWGKRSSKSQNDIVQVPK